MDSTAHESLTLAYRLLFERHGLNPGRVVLDEDPDWHTLPAYDTGIKVLEVGNYGTFPKTDDAILKFSSQSTTEPYTDVDGYQRANIIDTYCLVADWGKRLVIDPVDDEVKPIGAGAVPASWASYILEPQSKDVIGPRSFKVLERTSIWKIATRLKQPADALIEHNDLEDPHNIHPGTILHLPYPKDDKPKRKIRYEALPEARDMHVTRPDGARKWNFGNVRTWDDFTSSGFYPPNTNIRIVGVAQVPVEDKDNPDAEAGYYMDKLSFGDYPESGRVKYTTGYQWADLTDGKYVREVKAPEPEPLPEPEVKLEPSLYKTTYQPYDEPIACMVDLPSHVDNIAVREHDGRQPKLHLPQYREVKITGTFEKDGEIFGRLLLAKAYREHDYWYGIPMEFLDSEQRVYNVPKAADRIALRGAHSWSERLLTVPLSKLAARKQNKKRGSK